MLEWHQRRHGDRGHKVLVWRITMSATCERSMSCQLYSGTDVCAMFVDVLKSLRSSAPSPGTKARLVGESLKGSWWSADHAVPLE